MKRGAPFGNRNAFKHGRYTAAAKAHRRAIGELLRDVIWAIEVSKPFIRQGKRK